MKMPKNRALRIPMSVVLFLHLWLFVTSAMAQTSDHRIEIDGLLLDQTKTRAGHEFFKRFSTCWEGPDEVEPYNVLILENASAQWGSFVLIKVNDWVVFQSLLKPRDAEIRDLATKAIEQVSEYVKTNLKDGQKLNDDDLAGSGM